MTNQDSLLDTSVQTDEDKREGVKEKVPTVLVSGGF